MVGVRQPRPVGSRRAASDRPPPGCAGRPGFPPDEVDVVVDSHIDGVGANTRPTGDGTEVPAFPNARYVYSRDEIDALEAGQRPGAEALLALREAGLLETIDGDVSITDEVTVRAAPGHCSGHLSVRVDSGGDHAAVIGHLFLHPAQVFATDRIAGDADPAVLRATRTALLSEFCAAHTLVIGPLFAEPGAGHIAEHEGSWRLDAVA